MKKFLTKKVVITLSAVVVVVLGFLMVSANGNGKTETVSAQTEDLVRIVKISGKVVASDNVSLGFETSGTISQILRNVGDRVERGDVLVRLDGSTLASDVQKAEADLASAQAELSKLDGGGQYETSINNAKRALVQAIIDAYTSADDAVYNKTDQFFINPRGGRPEIFYAFEGYQNLRESINDQRVLLGEMLDAWKPIIVELSSSTYTEKDLQTAKSNLNQISLYLVDVSRAVNIFKANDSVPQTSIDKYKSDVLLARDSISQSSQSLTNEENSLRDLLADVPVQVARVESARANLLSTRTKLGKSALVSPIRGIVSLQDAKVGEVAQVGVPVVTIIGEYYEVETFVPEVSIAGIAVGNPATVTLDAYGANTIFKASVSHIDPAETIRDGVSTYKVKLVFDTPDTRVKSGMTANVEIETLRKPDTLLLPERAVLREGEETFVLIYTGDKVGERRLVEVGERDSRGNIEILSGITMEDVIILNPSVEK